jgi:hypothetical protein
MNTFRIHVIARRMTLLVVGWLLLFLTVAACHRERIRGGSTLRAAPVIDPTVGFASATDTSFNAAAHDATYVFEAKILMQGASTVSILRPGPAMATVEIGTVFRAPPENGNVAGDTITVVFKDSSNVPGVRTRVVVFAYGLILGKSIAVRDVKHVPLTPSFDLPVAQARLARADSSNADAAMRQHAELAVAVILGHVDSVAEVVVPDSMRAREGEHSMSWSRAWVSISRAFRPGDMSFSGRQVVVYFPAEASGLAAEPAQVRANESRILWLQQLTRLPANLRIGIAETSGYFVLQATDTRPSSDSTRVALALFRR